MNLHSILLEHTALCDRTYQLILEENSLLKTGDQPPDENFLERKRNILSYLSVSLSALREHGRNAKSEIPKLRTIIEKAQQIILKTLLLDRENEQLLLKRTMSARPPVAALKPSMSHLQKLYERHNAQAV